MFQKKQKKEEYIELRGLLGIGKDYHVYHMTRLDYLLAWILGFVAGFVVLLAFFNTPAVALAGGIVCAAVLPKYYREHKQKKKLNELRTQFKDLLESLTSSYSAGENTVEAFKDAVGDMISIYGEDADIVREVQIICTGLKNNINIEELLLDFARRSGLDDAMSFANVFEVCNRQGSDLKRIVSDTREIINDKIEMEMEIETMLSGSKNELYIMMVMPIVIVVMLKGLGTSMAGSNTPLTVLVKVVCIGIFGLAYVIGKKIIDIKI
ncbi:MAG TPA: type II secretion system F family protein [Candidatus Blautia faecavium]|uniref:Type II secretion system F family protein n=1 Tax=Candidatus Blautia faecavium TaxID=2838487 RepID=A0A9D2LQL2_9FIRM|nr:type II secretion system F family protein [Candidatus Blautia faecavium]